jgi:hypothetical protein
MSKFRINLLLQISKALINSKFQFLFEKNFSSEFGPPGPASPVLARSAPQAIARALGPSRPTWPWRNCQKPSLLRVCAARRRRLLPLSPPAGPHLSDSPPSPRRLTLVRNSSRFTAIDRPVPPGLHHCDANQSPLLPRLDSPSSIPVNTLPDLQWRWS